ncbi:MAG TPA: lipase maturation factor family protein [Enhygromyxa sp.]|nr:lipase maturation factor family protein [Enhygromyxa sp.]
MAEFDPPAVAALRRIHRALAGPDVRSSYRLTRKLLLRSLGFVYLIAFAIAVVQLVPLIGSVGLTPIEAWLDRLARHHGSRDAAFWEVPTLLWFDHSDVSLRAIAIAGLVISALVVLGLENAFAFVLLWILYLSIVHVGQRWYSFGWETQLLETGFIAVFWCPWLRLRAHAGDPPTRTWGPSQVPIWLYRWLIVRIMLGAGLIKLRGDPCWTELRCLDTHFATQPIPGPLSPWFHALPRPLLSVGVLFNHVAELLAPLFVFGPRRARHIAGAIIVGFQVTLIVSGNLAFLNWLTIVPALACFDDQWLRRLIPSRWRERTPEPIEPPPRAASKWLALVFAAVVAWLSLPVLANLLGRDQAMNRSYGRLHLVNTYGAFGSVGERRLELIVEGSDAEDPQAPDARWQAYEFRCKPGAVDRRPCWITPYHLRLDWLAWFAALEDEHRGGLEREDWLLHLVYKLLQGDPVARELLAPDNPFADAPPRWIRVHVYEYRMAPPSSDATWEREWVGELIGPVSGDDPRLTDYLRRRGWIS